MKLSSLILAVISLVFGLIITIVVLTLVLKKPNSQELLHTVINDLGIQTPEVIGFMPYWLINKADKDYTKYITELTYFGLVVNPDGSIQKYTQPGEAEPGWYALTSGVFKPLEKLPTSLLVFNGDTDSIHQLISQPASHAATLVSEINPIMDKYGFIELNLDLESFVDASASARVNFTQFIREVKERLNKPLTIDASPTDLIKPRLIDLAAVEPYVDKVVLMTYDYHYSGSFVTGPVAPLGGAGIYSEFDTETGIQKALQVLPSHKIILGIPLYGYEWESITDNPRAATLPGSGIVASNRRVEEFLDSCASCSAQIEELSRESYLIYHNQATNTYHQIFYPDEGAMAAKVELAKKYNIGGVALWALGYEGKTILNPLIEYKPQLK